MIPPLTKIKSVQINRIRFPGNIGIIEAIGILTKASSNKPTRRNTIAR
jgi:hypothetical protein